MKKNLNLNPPMDEQLKEYYITKLKKYNKAMFQTNVIILLSTSLALIIACIAVIFGKNIFVFGNTFERIYSTLFGFIATIDITIICQSIAERAGLESRINKIKESLEIYALKNSPKDIENQDIIDNLNKIKFLMENNANNSLIEVENKELIEKSLPLFINETKEKLNLNFEDLK